MHIGPPVATLPSCSTRTMTPVCFHVERSGPLRYTTLARSITSDVVKLCVTLVLVAAFCVSMADARQKSVWLPGRSGNGAKLVRPLLPSGTVWLTSSGEKLGLAAISNRYDTEPAGP